MSHKSRRSAIVLSIIAFVILSLCLVLFLPAEEEVSAEDIQRRLDSLGEEPGDRVSMRERAYELGAAIFDDPTECDRFADEVTELYFASRDMDFLLVYNTGGFGGGVMAGDPEWPGVLEGTKDRLAAMGYQSMIVEHQRGKGGFIDFFREVEEIKRDYRGKAPELAAKVAFLTKYNPGLKVILTGRCFGAVISNEVVKLAPENTQLYTIQAGRPFWYTDPGGERTLLIKDNGVMPDILDARGVVDFLWTLAKANFGRLPSTSPPEEGSFQAIKLYLKAPGHSYAWKHPGIRSLITAFVEQHFGDKGQESLI